MICFGNLDQGDNRDGTSLPAALHGPFVQISSGNFATYALSEDSSIQAFGRVFDKDVGPVSSGISMIDLPYSSGWISLPTNSGFGHSCASIFKSSTTQKV
jgi:hypothetical protein